MSASSRGRILIDNTASPYRGHVMPMPCIPSYRHKMTAVKNKAQARAERRAPPTRFNHEQRGAVRGRCSTPVVNSAQTNGVAAK